MNWAIIQELFYYYNKALVIDPDYGKALINKKRAQDLATIHPSTSMIYPHNNTNESNLDKHRYSLKYNNTGTKIPEGFVKKDTNSTIQSIHKTLANKFTSPRLPNNKYALFNKGDALINLGNYTQALEYLNKALSYRSTIC